MTRVSVGLPVYNAERYLSTAMDSLVAQTHSDLEIIISDNGSTDATEQLCRSYAARDDRIRYIRHVVNRGAAFNHNFVAEQATAPYFRWYAADDWMAPQCIEVCAAALDAHPEAILAWARPTAVDADGRPIEGFQIDLDVDNTSAFTRLRSRIGRLAGEDQTGWGFPLYGVARREDFLAGLPLAAYQQSDIAILARLAMRGQWLEMPEGLFVCRQHDGNSTQKVAPRDVARWMDPKASPARSAPVLRRFLAFAAAAARAGDVGPAERLRCVGLVLAWPLWRQHWRMIGSDVRVLLSASVRGRP